MAKVISIVVLVVVISLQSVQAQWVTNYRHGVKYNRNEGTNGPALNTTDYRLVPGTFSYRISTAGGPTNYYDRTSWNSDPYTQGHLVYTKSTPNKFKQNYRLLFPNNYNANLAEGYPIIIMMHGGGERGNCWGNNCYFSNDGWNAETNSPAVAGPTTNPNLLNNDHNLIHGGKPHLDAVNRAGSKLLGDPTLAYNAYPGFVLFPQNINGWSGTSVSETIRIIHKVLDENNIDRNKVVIHGLSNGAQNLVTLVKYDPALFAGVLLMSPSNANTKIKDSPELAHIPFWVFQGGKDTNPLVSETNSLVRWFQEEGGTIDYTIYDNLGHGTWNAAYAEQNFFPWIKKQDKSNIHVFFGDSTICASNGKGAKLGVSHGFQAYQWERDGQILAGADSSVYFADVPGVYRCRFSRFVANPSASDWNKWSKPVTIRESVISKPIVYALNTVHLPDINGTDSVGLVTTLNRDLHYTWYKNGAIVGDKNFFNVKSAGVYTVSTETLGGCSSVKAEAINITFNAPVNLSIPESLTALLTSNNKVRLNWEDKSVAETAYEVYRATSEAGFYKFLARLPEDAISYLDGSATSNDNYFYKIRAVSYAAVSPYTNAVFLSSGNDNEAPTTPLNLKVDNYSLTTATLSWDTSTDNEQVKQYIIYYGSDSVFTGSTSTNFKVIGLQEGRTFGFTVRAIDYSANLSLASNQVNVTTIFEGLTYEHSTGAYSSLTEIDWSFVEYFGRTQNFSISARTQEDYFSFKFDGYIHITEAGNYQFRSKSDDGSSVYLGGFDPQNLNTNLVFDNDGLHDFDYGSYTPQILTLAVGAYPITVLYFEREAGQDLQVEVKKDNDSWQVIPDAMLGNGSNVVNNPPVAPSNLTANAVGLSQINLSWGHSDLIPDNTNIVVLGASTAAGFGITPPDSAWVGRLNTWLGNNSTNYTLTNLAVGGFSTYEIRPDGSDNGSNSAVDPDHNITKALSLNPDYLIINLPSNNANLLIPADTTMAHYREIKALADKAGVKTFIITPQPRGFEPAKMDILLAELASVRLGFGNYVIDVFDNLANSDGTIKSIFAYSGDNIHLNKDGHAYIFSKVQVKLLSHFTQYEMYRSTTNGGSFSLLGAVNNGLKSYSDKQLVTGASYYYKVKAVNKNGVSPFSNQANATIAADTQAPSTPQNLVVVNTTFTNSSFTWDVSTDNDRIAYYEIKANDSIIGSSLDNTFYTELLLPGSTYLVAVRAVDRSGNRSAYSNTVSITSDQPTIFYSKSSGSLNALASWGMTSNGTGEAPTSFSFNGQIFRVANRTNATLATDWTIGGLISKVVVTENETVNLTANLIGKVEVEGNATLNVNGTKLPSFLESAATSNVVLTNFTKMPEGKFGHLTLNGSGIKDVGTGVHLVKGNLTIGNGITLKGSSSNNSSIQIKGNLNLLGTSAEVVQDNRVGLVFFGNKTHQINSVANLYLYQLTTIEAETIELNSVNKVVLTLGSQAGGGAVLAENTIIKLSDNALSFTGKANFNTANRTARISVNSGDIHFDVSTNYDSHLYFDADSNRVEHLSLKLTGSGKVVLEEQLNLYADLDLTGGEFHTGGLLTLKSDANQTAMIKAIPSGALISGTIKVERFVSALEANRYMGSPVSGVTVADWQNYFPITGNFTGASTGDTLGSSASLFRFSEPQGGWLAHPSPGTNNNVAIEVGKGYSAYIRDGVNDLTIINEGVPTQGDFSFTLTGGSTTGADDGWNLIANPYPATIDWKASGWTATGIGDVLSTAINETGNSQFFYFDRVLGQGTQGDGGITSGQGFWVQTIIQNPTLTITEQAKSTNPNAIEAPYFRPGNTLLVNYLKISLKELSTSNEDQTIIKFSVEGENIYNKGKDGFKRSNEIINFYSLTEDGQKVAINAMSNDFCQTEVGLGMYNVANGNYQIDFKNMNAFNIAEVKLIDAYLEDTVLLSANSIYEFTVDQSIAESFGDNRFILKIDRPTIKTEIPVSYIQEHCLGESVVVNITDAQHGAVYALKDSLLRLVGEEVVANSSTVELLIPAGVLPLGNHQFQIEAQYLGCSSAMLSTEVAVRIKTIQTPTIVKEVLETCNGISVVLYASGANANQTYSWYEEYSGITAINTSDSLIVDLISFEKAIFHVSIVSASGCKSANSAIVEIQRIEVIPLELSKRVTYEEVICAGEEFTVTIESSQLGMDYVLADLALNPLTAWVVGNGANVSFTFLSEEVADTIQMKLLVRKPGCNFVEMENKIEAVKQTTTIPILSKEISENCQNKTATLRVETIGLSFNWYYNDFDHPLANHKAILEVSSVDSVGYYYVTAVNVYGCESLGYDSILVSSEELYVEEVMLDLSVNYFSELCLDDEQKIVIHTPQMSVSYFVTDENGLAKSDTITIDNEATQLLEFSTTEALITGAYTWKIYAFKANCESVMLSSDVQFNVLDYPSLALATDNYALCSGETIIVSPPALSAGAYVKWFTSDGTELANVTNLEFNAASEGDFHYFLQAYNALGCSNGETVKLSFQVTKVDNPIIERIDQTLVINNLSGQEQVSWFLNGKWISSQSSIVLSQAGVYYAEAEKNDCIAVSDYFEYMITANGKQFTASDVLIYPNPTNNFTFTLSGDALYHHEVEVSLYDVFGRKIYQNTFDRATFKSGANISLKGQSPKAGVYLVTIQQGTQMIVKKIVMR